MKIIADEDIPFLKHYFDKQVDLVLKPGRSLTRDDLKDAQVLIVRSVKKIDKALLHGTSVKFVGSVSTGTDHLDCHWLDQAGISWCAAEGCNAIPVVEYVVSTIAALQKMMILPEKKCRAGVIGVGRIGRLVVDKLKLLGFDVVQCDPFRALQEENFHSTALSDFSNLDFIAIHVPLTFEGSYPTHHMIDKAFLQRQKKNCVLLNASRGSVVDFSDLKEYGELLYWCLDVWEHEPYIDFGVLQRAVIATPHIAGYSMLSKYRGIDMIYRAARALAMMPEKEVPVIEFPKQKISFGNQRVDWRDVVLKIFDPMAVTSKMQDSLVENGSEQTFDHLRKQFGDRCEFSEAELSDLHVNEEDRGLLLALGCQI